jgi:hypothetical protein
MKRIAHLLGSWAWIAYFEGLSQEARNYIECMGDLCISAITIAEVTQKYSSYCERKVEFRINDMLIRSPMIPVDRKIGAMAGTTAGTHSTILAGSMERLPPMMRQLQLNLI